MKLKNVLYLSLTASIVVPLLITTFLFAYFIKADLTDKVKTTDLPTALGEVKNAIELELSQSIEPSKALANNTFINDWIAKGEPQSELPAIQKYLIQVKATNHALTSFIVSSKTGNYYTDKGLVRKIGADDTWFDAFIQSDKPYDLSIDTDKKLDTVAVFTNYAIVNNGQRVALGGVGKSLDAMSQMIKKYKVGKTGIVYLADASGVIKIHPDKSKVGETIPIKDLINQIQTVTKNGVSYIESAMLVKSLGWYVVTEVPESELYGAVNSAVMMNVIIGLIIAALGIIGVKFLSNLIFKPVESITTAVTKLTEQDGDLTARLDIQENNEIGDLARQFNTFLDQLHQMLKQVSQTADNVKLTSEKVYGHINDAHGLSEKQLASTSSVAAAANEMEMTIKEISGNAREASSAATATDQAARDGLIFLNDTIKQMHDLESRMNESVDYVGELSDEIQSITQVLEVIRGISEQTNLLALNAAIEAARAGEQGRGFAVVADEVRTLAQRTAESTEEVNKMIEQLKAKATKAVSAINTGSDYTKQTSLRLGETGVTLKNITTEVEKVSEMSIQVATATREQAQATEEITHNMVVVSDTAKDTMGSMEASYSLCNELDEEAKSLSKAINHFTI